MKKLKFLAASAFLFFSTLAAFAQTANYSGEWELDVKKSKLPENSRVESITIVHEDDRLVVESRVKSDRTGKVRKAFAMPDLAFYLLNGAEARTQLPADDITPPIQLILKGAVEKDGNLKITSVLTVEQSGALIMKTSETWQLLDGGTTSKVSRETETRHGISAAEAYFTKTGAPSEGKFAIGRSSPESDLNSSLSTISGGVVNGKAINLVKPPYPPKARKERAYGTVNVQVVIDENGNVLSANAISGHELLRLAAESAARSSKFSPTYLEGKRVKVRGIIVYNFSWR